MTSQGSAHGRFSRAINRRNLFAAEIAIREMGGLPWWLLKKEGIQLRTRDADYMSASRAWMKRRIRSATGECDSASSWWHVGHMTWLSR